MSESLPKVATKHSIKVAVEEGKKYSWCSCGLSQVQPFCDGAHKAHKNSDGTSIMKSLAYEATETKIVSFCGCKHSKNPPFCDGSHKSLI